MSIMLLVKLPSAIYHSNIIRKGYNPPLIPNHAVTCQPQVSMLLLCVILDMYKGLKPNQYMSLVY